MPLSYGPRQKFLARISDEKYLNDPKLAIRLPRMSFEIVSLTYDSNTKLQKGITNTLPSSDPTKKQTILYPTTYRIGMQLNILAKNQDDALQILEQILPYFQPEYSVTIKEIDGNFKSDIPFVLQSVTLVDDYEGDFVSRRSIIYTLEFETRVRFYGPTSEGGIIRSSGVNLSNPAMTTQGTPYTSQQFSITPTDAGPGDSYEIVGTYDNFIIPDSVKLSYETISGTMAVQDTATGSTSGATGNVTEVGIGYIIVGYPDDNYTLGETVTNGTASFTITGIEPVYRTLDINFFAI